MNLGIDLEILLVIALLDEKGPGVLSATIAKKIKRTRTTVYKRLGILKKEGWLAVEQGYGNNKKYYYISDRYQLDALINFAYILNRAKDIEAQKRKR